MLKPETFDILIDFIIILPSLQDTENRQKR